MVEAINLNKLRWQAGRCKSILLQPLGVVVAGGNDTLGRVRNVPLMTMSQAGLGWARLDLKRVEWIKLVFQVQWTRMSAGVIREQKQGETPAPRNKLQV